MTLNIEEVARAMGAQGNPVPALVTGWSVDTRTQNVGDLYFALRGPNHDGHDFIEAAMEKGAVGVVLETRGQTGRSPRLVVPDTLRALAELGAWARLKWGGQVVGVTGSAGKTTTKDVIAHLLENEMPVGKTMGNFNNHV